MAEIPLGWSGRQGEPITVLLGAQWGDEGKGKIIDFLIQHNKVCFLFKLTITETVVFFRLM